MKKKDLTELRSKDVNNLAIQLDKLKIEAAGVKTLMKVGREKNLKKYKNLKRDIAHVLTILREKELVSFETDREKSDKIKTR